MFLPNSEEYALKKIELQKQKKAIERDYQEFVSDTIESLPVKRRDVIKFSNGHIYEVQRIYIYKSDLQILIESLEEKLRVRLHGIKQYANKKDWTKAGMIPGSGIVEKNGKPNVIDC